MASCEDQDRPPQGGKQWGWTQITNLWGCRSSPWYSHVVEDAPAAVGVPGAQAQLAALVLLAALHRHPRHLWDKTGSEGGDGLLGTAGTARGDAARHPSCSPGSTGRRSKRGKAWT